MLPCFQKIGGTPEEMLTELSRRTGGIPEFARDALAKAGMEPATIDKANEEGRKAKR